MTSGVKSNVTELLRHAAVRATLAPSVHNTQPWRFVVRGDVLEIHSDPARQLRVLDPAGRELMISCGCALFNARVSLAAAGVDAVVERFPDPTRPTLLARLRTPAETVAWLPLGKLDAVIERRQTNRRRFADEDVPPEVLHDLVTAVSAEGARLIEVTDEKHRLVLASLSQQADLTQNGDPAYRAELRAWTSDDPSRRDGVPAMAVPHVDAGSHDDIPIRDFDTRGMGWLPTATHSSMRQCLLLLGTDVDTPLAWLQAGEALEHMWLQATLHGYVASLLSQIIEVPRTRDLLRSELSLTMQPHILLRVGHAPVTPASRRRRLDDVLEEVRPQPDEA